MSDYASQEYPKWKYHRKLGGKIVHNAERKKPWRQLVRNPSESADTSQFVIFLQNRVKPHWDRWAWIVAAVSAILAVIGGIIKLWR